MKVAMFTNAYKPIIGGLERSVETFCEDLRREGHRTLIVTLSLDGAEASDEDVVRLPSIKKVAGSEFSLRLPVPAGLADRLDVFEPDLVHSHHPFMLGDTAVRVARRRGIPVVFTHHTLWERYAYVLRPDSEMLELLAEAIATEYANLCDLVIAPTASIRDLIRERGVTAPIDVIPTGVDVTVCAGGNGARFREAHGLPADVFVVGYLGRVVEAKNMAYLGEAVERFLGACPDAWHLVVGEGDSMDALRTRFEQAGVADRVVFAGSVTGGPAVADAYAAMDVFGFASKTETQGIVLIESFSAGVPVIALDAPGSRDVVEDGVNGRLLPEAVPAEEFAAALQRAHDEPEQRRDWARAARERAAQFDRKRTAERLLTSYRHVLRRKRAPTDEEPDLWTSLQERFVAEWDLFKEKIAAATNAMAEYHDARDE